MIKVLKIFTIIFGSLRFVLSPTLAAAIGAFIVHLAYPGLNGIIAAMIIMAIGISLGILWAISWWKKQGEDEIRPESFDEHEAFFRNQKKS
jgi:uncharacterized protein (DUF697 family)